MQIRRETLLCLGLICIWFNKRLHFLLITGSNLLSMLTNENQLGASFGRRKGDVGAIRGLVDGGGVVGAGLVIRNG